MDKTTNSSNKNIKFVSNYTLDKKNYKEFSSRIYCYKKIYNNRFNNSFNFIFFPFIY